MTHFPTLRFLTNLAELLIKATSVAARHLIFYFHLLFICYNRNILYLDFM